MVAARMAVFSVVGAVLFGHSSEEQGIVYQIPIRHVTPLLKLYPLSRRENYPIIPLS